MKKSKAVCNKIANKKWDKQSPKMKRTILLIWAEYHRILYATGKLPATREKALNEIPGWAWTLTNDKGLADMCSRLIEEGLMASAFSK